MKHHFLSLRIIIFQKKLKKNTNKNKKNDINRPSKYLKHKKKIFFFPKKKVKKKRGNFFKNIYIKK